MSKSKKQQQQRYNRIQRKQKKKQKQQKEQKRKDYQRLNIYGWSIQSSGCFDSFYINHIEEILKARFHEDVWLQLPSENRKALLSGKKDIVDGTIYFDTSKEYANYKSLAMESVLEMEVLLDEIIDSRFKTPIYTFYADVGKKVVFVLESFKPIKTSTGTIYLSNNKSIVNGRTDNKLAFHKHVFDRLQLRLCENNRIIHMLLNDQLYLEQWKGDKFFFYAKMKEKVDPEALELLKIDNGFLYRHLGYLVLKKEKSYYEVITYVPQGYRNTQEAATVNKTIHSDTSLAEIELTNAVTWENLFLVVSKLSGNLHRGFSFCIEEVEDYLRENQKLRITSSRIIKREEDENGREIFLWCDS